MSRRTFITQWDPRRPPNKARGGKSRPVREMDFSSSCRTVYDPASKSSRKQTGRDGAQLGADEPRFYPAALTDARFLARPMAVPRGKFTQRVGMFRNAKHSEMIFGDRARMERRVQHRLDKLVAPESDASIVEWAPNRRDSARDRYGRQARDEDYGRKDYGQDNNDGDDVDMDGERYTNRLKRQSSRGGNAGPSYDPYAFNVDDEEEEDGRRDVRRRQSREPAPMSRPFTRSMSGQSNGNSHGPSVAQFEALNPSREQSRGRRRERTDLYEGNKRLAGGRDNDGYDYREDARREERRRDGERRVEKRARFANCTPPGSWSPVEKRKSRKERETREREDEKRNVETAVPTSSPEQVPVLPPHVESAVAKRILSGLPILRLSEDNGQMYLAASKGIVRSALDRFLPGEGRAGGGGDENAINRGGREKVEESGPRGMMYGGRAVLQSLNDLSRHISISSDEEDSDDDLGGGGDRAHNKTMYENVFSSSREASPVLERLFEQTMLAEKEDPLLDAGPSRERISSSQSSDVSPLKWPPELQVYPQPSSDSESGSKRSRTTVGSDKSRGAQGGWLLSRYGNGFALGGDQGNATFGWNSMQGMGQTGSAGIAPGTIFDFMGVGNNNNNVGTGGMSFPSFQGTVADQSRFF